MKDEELSVITDSIKEKLGDEGIALIADDLGLLMSENTKIYNALNNKDKEITKLKENNEKLVLANGNLLQQVPVAHDIPQRENHGTKEESKKSISLSDCFDEKGHFKRTF